MKIKQKKGISLIVLVITIIVMIILATAIILALDASGIIGKAHEAKTKTNESALLEVATLLSAEWDLESKLGNITEDAETYISNGLREKGFTDEQIAKIEISETGVVKEKVILAYDVLKEGDFVTYIDNNGNEIPCVVLYDLESKDKIEIISVNKVGDVKLEGTSSGMPNCKSKLSTEANKYLNNKLANNARSVDDTDLGELSWELKESTAWNLSSDSFWVGAQSHDSISYYAAYYSPSNSSMEFVTLYSRDDLYYYPECTYEGTDCAHVFWTSSTNGLRPIFTLLDTVKIESGDGQSIDTAYKLSE